MTGFTVPKTREETHAAFVDARSASRWLAGQPRANATAMLAELLAQVQALNGYRMPAPERFKTLEVLRKTIFAVNGECQRRFEFRPLPLGPAEQSMFDATRRLWRACTVGYLHCLRACLESDSAIVGESAQVAHRIFSCLRLEQGNSCLAGAEAAPEFWTIAHSVWASAEQLGVARLPVVDVLLGETSESTVAGQYSMLILLQIAAPHTLSRAQLAATVRWLARWREQAKILNEPDANPKACCLPLDLSADSPVVFGKQVAKTRRWLAAGLILRKIRQRLELLNAGESPENLKLGSGLPAESCIQLLRALGEAIRTPLPLPEASDEAPIVEVAVGLENMLRLLGGSGLKDPLATTPFGTKLNADQIAVFGHVRRDEGDGRTERWQSIGRAGNALDLVRPVAGVEARLQQRGLIAVRTNADGTVNLATIGGLLTRRLAGENSIQVGVSLLPGEPRPLVAEIREKPAGKVSRHPAFEIVDAEGASTIVVPVGLPARSLSIRFIDAREHETVALQLVDLVERGSDHERWSAAPPAES